MEKHSLDSYQMGEPLYAMTMDGIGTMKYQFLLMRLQRDSA